jgi:hypothetical protein
MQVAVGLLVVGVLEGALVGLIVGAFEGAIVGGVVGTGACVGKRVGNSVGVEVGKLVGDLVGARVGLLDVGFGVVGGCGREGGMKVCVREWILTQISMHKKNNILTPTGACVACVQVPNVLDSTYKNCPPVRVVTPSTTTA